jgi:DNA-binding transcriptional ArsR family regulator/uncharacterized protein YndB with AHSA1/START domain
MSLMRTRNEAGSARGGSAQALIDALSSPIRREILWMVWDAELAAGDIAAAFDLTAGTISSHLTALREAGLVIQRRDGNFRRYRADRAAMEAVRPLLGSSDDKWNTADDIPEQALAHAAVQPWAAVAVEVPLSQDATFGAFVDPETFSAFLGVPVSIDEGRFSTELEWGTKVRGRYEVVAPPELIALRWDFEDQAVPVPGRQLEGYLRFTPTAGGCRVEVHQAAEDRQQAEFLSVAWSLVFGRLVEYAESREARRRARRPKHPHRDT